MIVAPAPAAPLDWVMFTPETLPASEFTMFVCLFLRSSSLLRSCTAYPRAFLSFLIPRAVTTTSSRNIEDSFIVTLITVRLLISSLTSSIPIAVNRRVAVAGALMEYVPSSSVATPVLVPSMITVTPTRGCPDLSTTFPLTLMLWANMFPDTRKMAISDRMIILIIPAFFCE